MPLWSQGDGLDSGSTHEVVRIAYQQIRPSLMNNYVLKLYITGKSPRTDRAIANIKRICQQELNNQYDLVIVDVLEHPELAEQAKVIATPTLIKELPLPLRRVIGDLSDTEKVLLGLDIVPHGA
jgi:circadian clock protein KaiB